MRIEQVATLPDADHAALVDFWVAAWRQVFPALDFDARRDWLATHLRELTAAGALLVVTRQEDGGPPTGFLTLDPASGEIDQLAVDPRHGGNGLARALIAEAKRLSPAGLTLHVNQGNPRALALYERNGFTVTGDGVSPRSGFAIWQMAWQGAARSDETSRALFLLPPAFADERRRGTPDAPGHEEPIMDLTLSTAQTLLAAALSHAREKAMKPLVVVVLDARGVVKAAAAEDGTSLKRFEIAQGKAHGALALGMGSRSIAKRAVDQSYFVAAVSHVVGGSLVPVAGGVLLRGPDGAVIGAAGASGDTSDNDEAAVMAGIAATGLKGDPGQD